MDGATDSTIQLSLQLSNPITCIKEALIKAFPPPDRRRICDLKLQASFAGPCFPPEVVKEMLI